MLVEELLERLAGLGADLLQGDTLMADDDALLRVALDVDDGIDMYLTVVLLEALHDDLYGVGYLLIVIEENLLADDFRDEEAGGLVRQLVFVEEGGTLRQQLLDALQQHVDAELVLGRDRQDFGVGEQGVPAVDDVSQEYRLSPGPSL